MSKVAAIIVASALIIMPMPAYAEEGVATETPVVIVETPAAEPVAETPAETPSAPVEESTPPASAEEVVVEELAKPIEESVVAPEVFVAPLAAPTAVALGDGVRNVSSVTVRENNLMGWTQYNRPYGADVNGRAVVEWTPSGVQSVNAINDSQYTLLYPIGVRLDSIDSLSYNVSGNATYQLRTSGWADGGTGGLVWEAVYNPSTGVYYGYWWRTGSALGVPNGVNASGTPYESRHQVTLQMALAANPDLIVSGYGISHGSYQPGTNVTDSIEIDGLTTFFRPAIADIIMPVATISYDACFYSDKDETSFVSATLTFDNTESNIPVEFVVSAPYEDLSRDVAAAATSTVQVNVSQEGAEFEVTVAGEVFLLTVPPFEGCEPVIPTVSPGEVTFSDTCGAVNDSIKVPGTLDASSTDAYIADNGDSVTTYVSLTEQGNYLVEDVTTVDGVRSGAVFFFPFDSANITEPGEGDAYVVIDGPGGLYAQWDNTFSSVACAVVNPPAKTTPSGGISTGAEGLFSDAASASSQFSLAGLGALSALLLGAAVALGITTRRRKAATSPTA
jgi:hypothetical protein